MNFRIFLILIHDRYFTIVNILTVFECFFFVAYESDYFDFDTAKLRFFSEIVQSARLISVSI